MEGRAFRHKMLIEFMNWLCPTYPIYGSRRVTVKNSGGGVNTGGIYFFLDFPYFWGTLFEKFSVLYVEKRKNRLFFPDPPFLGKKVAPPFTPLTPPPNTCLYGSEVCFDIYVELVSFVRGGEPKN